MKRKDLFWISIVSTFILIFSSIPNWVGYNVETKQLAYRGIFFDTQDYAVHMSMLRAGMQGDWAYRFRYTSEDHRSAYTRLFYLVLGQTNRLFRLKPALYFEIARWVFGYSALYSIYLLSKRFFYSKTWQHVAFLLVVFGSGLGWLQLLFGYLSGPITPVDFWLIDAYVFFGIALFPHFSFVTAALCVTFFLYLDYLANGGWTRIVGIVIVAILTQFVNPIAFILIDLTIFISTTTTWIKNKKIGCKQVISLGVIAIAQLPLLIYNFNLLTNDPIWRQFTRQNQTLSPPPIYYLWGFGILWICSLIGLISAIRQKSSALLSAASWIIVSLLLAYAPFAIQRRFLHGITIPLGLLSTQGLMITIQHFSQKSSLFMRWKNSLLILSVFLISLSSIYLTLGRSIFLRTYPADYFYSTSLNPAIAWLNENASINDFVIGTVPTSQLITQKTDLRVYLGHSMETLDYENKDRLVKAFFLGKSQPNWLESTNARWVIFGPYEQSLTGKTKLSGAGLKIVFRSPEVTLFQVSP